MGGEAAVDVRGLTFGPIAAPVLEDITFSLPVGHFMGIVGPNGAGKSTLLALMVGMLKARSGSVRFADSTMDMRHRRRILQRVAFLHQLHDHQPSLPITVEEVVAMGHPKFGTLLWRRSKMRDQIAAALEQVGMVRCIDKDFRFLSGGQRQRVRLARALMRNPAVLLLDEPSAALDTPAQDQLYRLFRRLCDQQGKTIIMVEHDIAAISAFVDSVACLNRRIHHHAMAGEQIPPQVWQDMYGSHMHVMAHDHDCIGCHRAQG